MAFDPDNMEIYKASKPELPPGHYSTSANRFDVAAGGRPLSEDDRIAAAEAEASEAGTMVNLKSPGERTPEEIERAETLLVYTLKLKSEANLHL